MSVALVMRTDHSALVSIRSPRRPFSPSDMRVLAETAIEEPEQVPNLTRGTYIAQDAVVVPEGRFVF